MEKLTVSLSAEEEAENVWRVVFHVIGNVLPDTGDESSRKRPEVERVVFGFPFQSASGQYFSPLEHSRIPAGFF